VALLEDYAIHQSIPAMKTAAMSYLLDNKTWYSQFYDRNDADQLVTDAIAFMMSPQRNYASDVMDIIVDAVTGSMNIRLQIYERGDDSVVKVLSHSSHKTTADAKVVFLVLSRDNLKGLANHYSPLVKTRTKSVVESLDLSNISEMADDD
jgi:hypothetical protein